MYAGLVSDGNGNYYYIGSGLIAVVGKDYYISKPNGLLPAATYTFDKNGRLVMGKLGNDLYLDPDGEIRYYVDGEAQYAGVVRDGAGNYYYINSTKKAIRNTTYYITKTNGLIPAGNYTVGADGVIITD